MNNMSKKITVGILTGGSSIERGISLLSCANVLDNIDYDKYEVWVNDVNEAETDWIETLIKDTPDVIFSTLHGGRGENGSMQGLLHYLGIPFIGSKVLSSSLCMDKYIAKTIMRANHIPVIQDIYIKRNEDIGLYKDAMEQLGYPLIIKPNRGGSSIGVKICRSFEDALTGAEAIIKEYDDDILIEKYINGRELSCCILEDNDKKNAAIMDIRTQNEIFTYEDKYGGKSQLVTNSLIPVYMQDMIKAIALKTFDALKCRGYAVADMIIKEEQVYVIEVNTLPGLTQNSIMPKAAEAMGYSFREFIDKLIEFEMKEH